VKTLQELNKDYHSIFHLEDEALLPLLVSMVVGARLNAPPVWLFLIGPSSGGKSTMLSVINKVKFITELSDLTTNTFLSGMKVAGKETSLLKKLGNNFVVVMKDFTTMIAKDDVAKGQIIAQMREIYDGYISKATGHGDLIVWGEKEKRWKGTFIMAATEGIFKIQEDFADMGTRAINYVFLPQHRKNTTRASIRNKRNNEAFNTQLGILQNDVAEFVDEMIANAPDVFPLLDPEFEEEIIDVADLSSMCRSIVVRDYRGEKSLALSAEFPMRMAEQLLAIAQFMTYVNGGTMTEPMKKAVYKTAFDSIPKQRRLVLEILARHPKVEVSAASMQMNYPPALVRAWIEDLHMFGIVDRSRMSGKEFFNIRSEHRMTLRKYLGIEMVEEDLESDENGEVSRKDMSWEEKEAMIAAQSKFDEDFK
jgi:hypothetical protein